MPSPPTPWWWRPDRSWTLARIEVTGEEFPGRDHLLATWLPESGDIFAAVDFDRAINQVLLGAGEAGHPFARWVTRDVQLDVETATVNVQASLLAGYAAWLGPITTSLPPGRASDFAVRTSGLQAGAPFRQSDLQRAVDRLLSRDLYARVETPLVHLTAALDTVGVHLPVVARRKINRAQVILGLSRPAGGRHPGQRRGGSGSAQPGGHGPCPGGRLAGRRQGTNRFGFPYLEPLAFGTPLDTDLALDNEVLQDVYTRFRLDNRWRLPVVDLWGLEVGIGWDRSTYPIGSLERTTRMRARGAVLHRRGDRTRSGWEGIFAVETAWRSATLRADTTGGLAPPAELGEATNQRIFEVDASGELWVSGASASSAAPPSASCRRPTGVVPLSEQFRFGGANSLRGYREDDFHGTRAAWGAVELRIGEAEGSRLYTFYDLGYFAFTASEPTVAIRSGWCAWRAGPGATGWASWPAPPAAISPWPSASPAPWTSIWPSCTSPCWNPSERRCRRDRRAPQAECHGPRNRRAGRSSGCAPRSPATDDLYYNSPAAEISDAEYDALEHQLADLEAAHPELAAADSPTATVGGDQDARFPSAPHSRPMLSLQNSYDLAEVAAFDERIAQGSCDTDDVLYTVEPKMDGVAVAVRYRDGRLDLGADPRRRQPGDVITANVATIAGVPAALPARWRDAFPGGGVDACEARGEVFLALSRFRELNAHARPTAWSALANPRNATAGTLKTLDSDEVRRRGLSVFFYQLFPLEAGRSARCGPTAIRRPPGRNGGPARSGPAGQPVPAHGRRGLDELQAHLAELEGQRPTLDYQIDGAVIKVDGRDWQERPGPHGQGAALGTGLQVRRRGGRPRACGRSPCRWGAPA